MSSTVATYFDNIRDSVSSIYEGLAVTMSHMFREPATIQYPYHPRHKDVSIGGPDSLPDRYRGFLEVDMDICTACLKCEKACPIDCINIDIEKVPLPGEPADAKPVRALVRFDIDMAKCMYCGLCQEPCPTNAIRHTKHFEGAVSNLEHLVARFVDPQAPVVPFKVKKGVEFGTDDHGSIVKSLLVDRQWDLGPIDFPAIPRTGKKAAVGPVDPFQRDLSDLAKSAQGVAVPKLAVILEQAMAGTDCGACQYPTCKEYSEAIAKGECTETFRCEPGGADSAIEAEQIVLVFKGEWEKRRAEKAAGGVAASA